jgi:hypothetical protein
MQCFDLLGYTPMKGFFSTWTALGLAVGLFNPSVAFGEGGCLIIEMPVNQTALPGDLKASAGDATPTVHPRAKGKAQSRTPQRSTNSALDDTQVRAIILDQSAPAYCSGARIVDGDESGHYLHATAPFHELEK